MKFYSSSKPVRTSFDRIGKSFLRGTDYKSQRDPVLEWVLDYNAGDGNPSLASGRLAVN